MKKLFILIFILIFINSCTYVTVNLINNEITIEKGERMEVVKLSEKTNNGLMRTPIEALEDCMKDIKEDEYFKKCNKILIIPLTADGDDYSVSYYQAGLKCSESLALLEVIKTRFLTEMGYI